MDDSRTCTAAGCAAAAVSRGLCNKHYLRLLSGRPPGGRKCETCGSELAGAGKWRWCSLACRPRCPTEGCERPVRTSGLCAYHYNYGIRECLTCGAEVSNRRRYCSDECKPRCQVSGCVAQGRTQGLCDRHYFQQRKFGAPVEFLECPLCKEVHPALQEDGTWRKVGSLCVTCHVTYGGHATRALPMLYERDGYNCSLCGDLIDVTLRHPDPMSGSVDHVIPLSLGGPNVMSNLAPAHLVCNFRKGNRVEVSPCSPSVRPSLVSAPPQGPTPQATTP